MCIMDGTCYDLTTGVFTDFAQPISGYILELRQIFWSRWNDCSIVFMTWGHGEPAAVASVEIYELDDLPAMEQMGQDIKSAMAEGRLAWLRRALSGYIIRKCRDLLKSEG